MNLITAGGIPALVEEFNTPLDSRELVQSFSSFVADHVSLTPFLSLDVSAVADFSRGSLPAQSSPAGAFAPARTFAPQPDLIVWNSLSPRAGLAWQVPHAHGLVLRGAYSRLYAPLAGRYLDGDSRRRSYFDLERVDPGLEPQRESSQRYCRCVLDGTGIFDQCG